VRLLRNRRALGEVEVKDTTEIKSTRKLTLSGGSLLNAVILFHDKAMLNGFAKWFRFGMGI